MMLGQEPRQTTSNLGHLNKPSIQALIHGLNRHYYSIAISYRKNELEEGMLMNLQKKAWTHGLTLKCAHAFRCAPLAALPSLQHLHSCSRAQSRYERLGVDQPSVHPGALLGRHAGRVCACANTLPPVRGCRGTWDAGRGVCVSISPKARARACRDFEGVAKENEKAVAEMRTLADSFEREVAEEGELEPSARVVARRAAAFPCCRKGAQHSWSGPGTCACACRISGRDEWAAHAQAACMLFRDALHHAPCGACISLRCEQKRVCGWGGTAWCTRAEGGLHLSREWDAARRVGKMDAKKHLDAQLNRLMSANIVQTLGTMLDTLVF